MSKEPPSIGLTLDLRRAKQLPASPADFLVLWNGVAKQLVGHELAPAQVIELTELRTGSFSLQVMHVPASLTPVRADTPFAIHAVLEPQPITRACQVCAEQHRRGHAPFACVTCREAAPSAGAAAVSGTSALLCAEHAHILDGDLRSYCPAHVPLCSQLKHQDCKNVAAGWCFGPTCGSNGRAHCAAHLRQHSPELHFCHRCHEVLFPPCSAAGCDSVATIRCSHWDPARERACGKTYCARHALRWQVYGPQRLGLARCVEHGELARLDDEQLIFQLTAGALVEKRKRPPGVHERRLPSLQSVTHILMRPRRVRYDIDQVNALFEAVRARLDLAHPFQKKMSELLDAHRPFRQENLARDAQDKAEGQIHFEKLLEELRRRGFDEIASELRFADYRPNDRRLFVRLHPDWRGRFIGAGGRNIKDFELAIGVSIEFELGEP